tara:strand:- start:386 stop:493 length:108 start_codon:yes stop_codon:yes gene_type:complete
MMVELMYIQVPEVEALEESEAMQLFVAHHPAHMEI